MSTKENGVPVDEDTRDRLVLLKEGQRARKQVHDRLRRVVVHSHVEVLERLKNGEERFETTSTKI